MLQEKMRAWLNIGIGVVLSLLVMMILFFDGLVGPMKWEDWQPIQSRISVACLLIATVWFLGMLLTRRSPGAGEVVKDERDRLVANKALAVQAWSVQVLLLIWMIWLTETYFEAGGIPIAFPFLMWLSCSLAALMTHGIATLVWYRKMGS